MDRLVDRANAAMSIAKAIFDVFVQFRPAALNQPYSEIHHACATVRRQVKLER